MTLNRRIAKQKKQKGSELQILSYCFKTVSALSHQSLAKDSRH